MSQPTKTPGSTCDHEAEVRAGGAGRTAAAYLLVALTPGLAWLIWVSWSGHDTSDQQSVAWFVTVAIGCAAAGGLVPPRWLHGVLLAPIAVLTTLVALVWWWGSEDDSGLFVVGILFAVPLLLIVAPGLLLLGAALGRLRR